MTENDEADEDREVSALRQEAAGAERVAENLLRVSRELLAARQEAAITKAAHLEAERELTDTCQEAEALRDSRDEYHDEWREARDDLKMARQEAEALRGQLAEAIKMIRSIGAAGAVCWTHGKAVLVTHVDDGQPCPDYQYAARVAAPREPTNG